MKRIGSITLSILLGIATWYAGPSWQETRQQAFAQTITPIPNGGDEAYRLSYFDVATAFRPSVGGFGGAGSSGGSGDAVLRIVDAGNWEGDSIEGKVCANIYVFNDVQEEQECCSCPLTADALLTLSVIANLTSNPFNPQESLSAGVVKIVGSEPADAVHCNNTIGAVTAANLGGGVVAGGLHTWLNHTEKMASNQAKFTPPFGFVTDTSVDEFEHSDLDSGELGFLEAGCTAINNADSHGSQTIGVCSCGPPPPPPITVSVAYANNYNSNPPFTPTNGPGWKGSPGVTPGVNYFGFAGAGDFDGGGILIENNSATDPVVVNSVTVDFNQPSPPINCTIGTGTTIANCPNIESTATDPTDPWVGVFPHAIPPGGFLILGQSNAGLTLVNPMLDCTEPGIFQCDNFDTSDLPPLGVSQDNPSAPKCEQGNVIPKLHVNVTIGANPAVTLNFTDTTKVLNTGGVDQALCFNGLEGSDWVEVH